MFQGRGRWAIAAPSIASAFFRPPFGLAGLWLSIPHPLVSWWPWGAETPARLSGCFPGASQRRGDYPARHRNLAATGICLINARRSAAIFGRLQASGISNAITGGSRPDANARGSRAG